MSAVAGALMRLLDEPVLRLRRDGSSLEPPRPGAEQHLPPARAPEALAAIARALDARAPQRWSYGLGPRRFEARVEAVGEDEVVALIHDVTEVPPAERRLRQVIDLVPHFIFAKDITGRFILVNRAVAEAYGTTVESLLGKTDADFASSEAEVERFRADDLDVIRSGRPKRIPQEVITDASGNVRVLETIKIPFTEAGSGLPAVLGVATDITARKRLEEQLLQAQKMESVGRLAGGVAHDFNNLLTVVLMAGESLASALPIGGPMRDHIDGVLEAARRASGLTRQLLAFARRQPSAPRVVRLGELAARMDRLLRRTLGDDIELRTRLCDGEWAVEVDPGQMEQVLLNLAVNARDAMPRGGRLTIETRNVPAEEAAALAPPLGPRASVELRLSDTGEGMTPETLARIFEPFFTTKPVGVGTGLGLATCYGIVQQVNGRIWADSSPGAGATFHVLVPRTERAETAMDAAEPVVARGGETVLIVEDNQLVREVTADGLRRFGYDVLVAAGSREALELAAAHKERIHLLLTDVVMPDLSGPEVAERLTALRPGLRTLFMSGYVGDALGIHGVSDAQVLPKPFSAITLARRVRDVLDR
jgi:two-component system, cell cycle sensor histidine kinase and response regulator CckA